MILPDGLFAPPIAHRGLWRPGEAVENSLVAFEKACQAGYGIELDVRLSSDGEAVVFHDETLARLAGVEAAVGELTADELTSLPLQGGPDRIPTLEQTLRLVAGRAMMLVEIKAAPGAGDELEARTAALLDHYDGPAAVISFEAQALAWFARRRPDRPRGLDAIWLDDEAAIAAFDAQRAEAQPHFLVLEREAAISPTAAGLRTQGLPVIAWTVRAPEEASAIAERCDNFIFEGFTA